MPRAPVIYDWEVEIKWELFSRKYVVRVCHDKRDKQRYTVRVH